MKIQVDINFNQNFISIKSGDLAKQINNLIAIENTTKKIIDIGSTATDISSNNPRFWEENKTNISFEPIFSSQNFDPEKMALVTILLASNILTETRGHVPWDRVNFHINIPNYKEISSEKRKSYENSLEGWNKIAELSLNGETLVFKNWKYRFAEFSLKWGSLIFLIVFLIVFFQIPNKLSPSFNLFILLFIVICRKWMAELLWMFLMQVIIDKKGLRKIFDKEEENYTFPKKFSVSNKFANIILGENTEPQ